MVLLPGILKQMDSFQLVLNNVTQSIKEISQLNEKNEFRIGKFQRISITLDLLKCLIDDLRNVKASLIGTSVQVLEQLDSSLVRLKELVERCSVRGSQIYQFFRSQQYAIMLRDISSDISHALKELLTSSNVSDHTRKQVEQVIDELKRVEFTVQALDNQSMQMFESILKDQREIHKTGGEKLKWIVDKFRLLSNQEVLREASALEKEKECFYYDNNPKEKHCIDQMISMVMQICDRFVEVKQLQTEGGVTIPADFRCPLSLELMSDPVIIASGQTYERAYIQSWIEQGMTTCPKTRQALCHTNLIPNYTVKALIANWCELNNVPIPKPVKHTSWSVNESNIFQSSEGKEMDKSKNAFCSGDENKSDALPTYSSSSFSCDKSIFSEDHIVNDEKNPASEISEEHGNSSSQSETSTGGYNVFHSTKDSIENMYIHEGHSRNASSSSFASSLEDGQAITREGKNRYSGFRDSSDMSQYNSDASGELRPTSSDTTLHNVGSEISSTVLQRSQSNAGRWRSTNTHSRTRANTSSLGEMKYEDPIIVAKIESLIDDLESEITEVQRQAAAELRLLAKYKTDNRMIIANRGAIKPLVALLRSPDPKIQEHAVTALLNLSLNDSNKDEIAAVGAIDALIFVLKTGSTEARENAAATLFSLSAKEENKVTIGQSGAISSLVDLLQKGTQQGKKDAATALFSLSIYHENKVRIVRAGAVKPLVDLVDLGSGMVDKAVAVLSNLSSIPEGCQAIAEEGGIPALVEVVELGSQRGKENAAAALLQICMNGSKFRIMILQEGAIPALMALSQSGTPRAKEKAQSLLRYFRDQRRAAMGRSGSETHIGWA